MMSKLGRSGVLIKALRLIIFLRTGRRTTEDITQFMKCSQKTARRYIKALEQDCNIPIIVDYDSDIRNGIGRRANVYWIDRKWTL